MDRIFHYQITENERGTTVLDFLRKKGFSRHILSSMKADKEALTRNGQRIGGREQLLAGDYFRVRLLETVDSDGIIPVSMPLSILYEDEDILVINKPADMPVHPSIGNYTNTLANGVAAYLFAANIPAVNFLALGYARELIVCGQRYGVALFYALLMLIAVVTYAAGQSYGYRNHNGSHNLIFEF